MIFVLENHLLQALFAGVILSVPVDGHETGLIYIYLLKKEYIKIDGTYTVYR